MARKIAVLRAVLFMVFFSVGLGGLTVSLLADELLELYITNRHLERTKETNKQLEAICKDYDAVFEQIETDPNIIQRLSRITLGTDTKDEQTAYPRATLQHRQSAEKVVLQTFPRETQAEPLPGWVIRCCRPLSRTILFLAGAGLIVISFTCFGTRTKTVHNT